MVPVLATSAGTVRPPTETERTAPVTLSETSLSPYRSSVAVLAPASTT